MARVNIKKADGEADTPTQTVVKSALATARAVSEAGRLIVVRKLSALQRLRMLETLGDNAKNEAYMSMAGVAYCVSEIDGDKVQFPTSKLQLEALVDRLSEDGLEAAQKALTEMLGISVDDDGNVMRDGEVIRKAKN